MKYTIRYRQYDPYKGRFYIENRMIEAKDSDEAWNIYHQMEISCRVYQEPIPELISIKEVK
jgi:hypothetical protein